MKNPKMNKNQFYVLPVISFLGFVALVVIFVIPKITDIQTKQANIQTETEKQRKLEEKNKFLEQLNKNIVEQTAQMTAVNVALPSQKEVPNLIIQLQRIAQESDVEIQSIQISPGILVTDKAAPTKIGPELSFKMAIRGNYEAILTFLDKIYKAKRLINMDTITLSTSGSDSDGNVSVTLTMNTYYQPVGELKPTETTAEVPKIGENEKKTYDTLQTSYTSYALDNVSEIQPRVEETPTQEASDSAAPADTIPQETSPSATLQ